jgi:uroporphyrin-III C-methyltransferase
MTGKVYLVGAGPGAPDLLTLRAARLLERAEIVFYDALVHPETVALAVRAKRVAVGKRCSQVSTDQRFINRNLVEAAHRHEVVVRLKGGDPMLFGRAQEEIDALARAGIEFEIVPGISAAFAASADVGVSLTRRGLSRSVAFVTPRVGNEEEEGDWAPAVVGADTAVLYMGVGQAPAIARCLLDRGMSPGTPVRIVENASLASTREFRLALSELHGTASLGITGPALIMLGGVFRSSAVESVAAPSSESSVIPRTRRG